MADIEKVKKWLAERGIDVWQYAQPTPTAELAAQAVGCGVAEIAKTLLFYVGASPLVVVTCGDMKVKSSLLKQETGYRGKVKLPQGDDVLLLTGYAPGGVCPFMLPEDLPVFLDSSLKRFELVYSAGGNDASAVPLKSAALEHLTGGRWVDVCEAKMN